TLGNTLKQLIADVDAAIGGAPNLLADAVKAIDTKFGVAITDLQQRIADTRQAIETAAVLPDPQKFPAPIAKVLTQANADFDNARALLAKWDETAARQALSATTSKLPTDVDSAAATWRTNLQNALDTTLQQALPANLAPTYTEVIASLKTLLA